MVSKVEHVLAEIRRDAEVWERERRASELILKTTRESMHEINTEAAGLKDYLVPALQLMDSLTVILANSRRGILPEDVTRCSISFEKDLLRQGLGLFSPDTPLKSSQALLEARQQIEKAHHSHSLLNHHVYFFAFAFQ